MAPTARSYPITHCGGFRSNRYRSAIPYGFTSEKFIVWRVRERIRSVSSERVHLALKDGALVRPRCCSSCGKRGKKGDRSRTIEAHHPDYAYPLSVLWLCPSCHREEHRCMRLALRDASAVRP